MSFTTEEVNEDVRFKLGGLSVSVMTDLTLNKIIDGVIEAGSYTYEDSDKCIVTFYSLIETLRYLILQQEMNSGGVGKTTRRREKNSRREIEVEYSEIGDTGYSKMLSYFMTHPEVICKSLVKTLCSRGPVYIGGTSKSEYDKVQSNKDSRDGYQAAVNKHFDKKTSDNIRYRKGVIDE